MELWNLETKAFAQSYWVGQYLSQDPSEFKPRDTFPCDSCCFLTNSIPRLPSSAVILNLPQDKKNLNNYFNKKEKQNQIFRPTKHWWASISRRAWKFHNCPRWFWSSRRLGKLSAIEISLLLSHYWKIRHSAFHGYSCELERSNITLPMRALENLQGTEWQAFSVITCRNIR